MKHIMKHIQPEVIKDKVANRIANCILNVQISFSNFLGSITGKWNQRNQWAFLILVSLIFGGLSVLAIVTPFQLIKDQANILPIHITPPKTIPGYKNEYKITGNEFQKVQEYKSNHPNLQVENSPLFDSLKLIEQIYHAQKIIK